MEILNKFLRNNRLKFHSKSSQPPDDVFQSQLTDHQFDRENIRFIIFRDHDLKGRTVFFDSLKDGVSDQSKSSRSSTDLKKLADMMFGTLPLSRKMTTFKVHAIRSPPQLMITKVFIPQPRSRESTNDLGSFDLYSIESLSTDDRVPVQTEAQDIQSNPRMARPEVAHSMPLDVPLRVLGATCSNTDDTEFPASFNHSPGAPYARSVISLSSSYSSRDRRKRRHKAKMIEQVLTSSVSDDKPDPIPLHKRPTKIGIAVIFMLPEENSPENRSFQTFFFSHIMLIENYVHQLKGAIDKALAKRSQELIDQAIDVFLGAMSSLYTAPRLKDPAWLSMMTYTTRRMPLSARFLKDFMMLVEKCHTKNTKFFFGTLITAVLTHHLSWAPTVAPVEESPSQTYLDKHAAKWVNSLGRSHPYNPLWAQLGDLYGAIGVPVCLARTVVIGRKQELVSTILFVLSYFIRCSEILENVESFPDFSGADNHSSSSSETSSVAHEDDLTLKSPVPDSKENWSCMSDSNSSCATSVLKTVDKKSTVCCGSGLSSREEKPGFHTTDLDGCRCCPGISDCSDSAEIEPIKKGLALFVKPPETSLMNCSALTDSKTSVSQNDDTPTSPTSPSSNAEQLSSTSPTKKQKSFLTLQLECRLKDDEINENPKIEIERTLGKTSGNSSPLRKVLHRVPLGDGPRGLPESITDYLPTNKAGLKNSNQKATLLRGISMFDEYFESNIPVPCLNMQLESLLQEARHYNGKMHSEFYDVQTLDDIVNEPCPDVSHLQIDRLPKRSGTFDTGIDFDFEESTQLDNEHFGEMDIEGVVNLPDGPSKQYLQKAVSMLQDQFTTSGLSLDGDRLCLSGDSIHERLERSNSNHAKSRKKRHGSGQSMTMLLNRCRSVTLSESSHNNCNMANYIPVPMPSSCELLKADGCIYLSDECNFGRSLLGDYCSCYTSHFVLHGTSDRQFLKAPYTRLHQDLQTSVQNSVLDEPVAESTFIVADTDNWSVQLFSCKSRSPDEPLKPLPLSSSLLVCNLIESVYELGKLKMSPEFCLLHLEDQLQSIYLKSQRLADFIKVCRKVYAPELATLLSLDISDMPLLLAVARTHSPQLFRNL